MRTTIIESKNHARLASLKRPEKLEMVEWMLVWLRDPDLFETWVRLRLRSLAADEMTKPDADQTDEDGERDIS